MSENMIGSAYGRKIKMPNPHVGRPKKSDLRKQSAPVSTDSALPAGLQQPKFSNEAGQPKTKAGQRSAAATNRKPLSQSPFQTNVFQRGSSYR